MLNRMRAFPGARLCMSNPFGGGHCLWSDWLSLTPAQVWVRGMPTVRETVAPRQDLGWLPSGVGLAVVALLGLCAAELAADKVWHCWPLAHPPPMATPLYHSPCLTGLWYVVAHEVVSRLLQRRLPHDPRSPSLPHTHAVAPTFQMTPFNHPALRPARPSTLPAQEQRPGRPVAQPQPGGPLGTAGVECSASVEAPAAHSPVLQELQAPSPGWTDGVGTGRVAPLNHEDVAVE
jgi:hypothetical protein